MGVYCTHRIRVLILGFYVRNRTRVLKFRGLSFNSVFGDSMWKFIVHIELGF